MRRRPKPDSPRENRIYTMFCGGEALHFKTFRLVAVVMAPLCCREFQHAVVGGCDVGRVIFFVSVAPYALFSFGCFKRFGSSGRAHASEKSSVRKIKAGGLGGPFKALHLLRRRIGRQPEFPYSVPFPCGGHRPRLGKPVRVYAAYYAIFALSAMPPAFG